MIIALGKRAGRCPDHGSNFLLKQSRTPHGASCALRRSVPHKQNQNGADGCSDQGAKEAERGDIEDTGEHPNREGPGYADQNICENAMIGLRYLSAIHPAMAPINNISRNPTPGWPKMLARLPWCSPSVRRIIVYSINSQFCLSAQRLGRPHTLKPCDHALAQLSHWARVCMWMTRTNFGPLFKTLRWATRQAANLNIALCTRTGLGACCAPARAPCTMPAEK